MTSTIETEDVVAVAVAIGRADLDKGYEYDHLGIDHPEVSDWSIHLALAALSATPIERLREENARREWQPIETATKDYRDGQPPLLTWSALAGYGLTFGPMINGGYGHQTHWMTLPEPPAALTPSADDDKEGKSQ